MLIVGVNALTELRRYGPEGAGQNSLSPAGSVFPQGLITYFAETIDWPALLLLAILENLQFRTTEHLYPDDNERIK